MWFVDLTNVGTDHAAATEVARSIGLEIPGGDVVPQVAEFVAGSTERE